MKFSEQLNEYIERIECTAKELCDISGLSAASISRYRSGERVPEIESETFDKISFAISEIAKQKNIENITEFSVTNTFLKCSDVVIANREQIRQNFDVLVSTLNINVAKLCQYTNYDTSTIFRFRNGSRQPSDPNRFISDVASYISNEFGSISQKKAMAKLFNCNENDLCNQQMCYNIVKEWLFNNQIRNNNNISDFLIKLDEFDLNEYIQAIKFDKIKIPTLPFQLPTSKTYFGLKEMMDSELDFLKATVLSKSNASVIMYSDMPMGEMAKDPEFPKKWMIGMAMMLKKGLHLNQIHNLDRTFEDMMLGLESWIPMYMTGQISPYYLKNVQNNVFMHILKVSGTAALSGEAIAGYHSNGKYYLTKSKDEVAYYRERASELLENAQPLMDIYRADRAKEFTAFMLADSQSEGNRRNILSAPPIYTMNEKFLNKFLSKRKTDYETKDKIFKYFKLQKNITENILKTGVITDEIPYISENEFKNCKISLSLSGMFCETDIFYNYNEYMEHLNQTKNFEKKYNNYFINLSLNRVFNNLQILIHENECVIVSKNKSPAIHFIIHHPKLRNAIENFIPPITEE